MIKNSHGSRGGDVEKEERCLIKYCNLPDSTCSRRMMLSLFGPVAYGLCLKASTTRPRDMA